MTFPYDKAFTNPDYNRAEWRAFLGGAKIGDGTKVYFLGDDVETSAYTVNVESTDRATIAQYLPVVTNTDGGITFPNEFRLNKGRIAQEAILAAALLGKVDMEFDLLLVYGNLEVLENGTAIPDACFAQKAKAKATISSMGGAGAETIVITPEIRTSGDIYRGYVTLGTSEAPNYDPDEETWLLSAFTSVPTLDIPDIKVRAGA